MPSIAVAAMVTPTLAKTDPRSVRAFPVRPCIVAFVAGCLCSVDMANGRCLSADTPGREI